MPVRWLSETWAYGQRLGVAFSIETEDGERIFRQAAGADLFIQTAPAVWSDRPKVYITHPAEVPLVPLALEVEDEEDARAPEDIGMDEQGFYYLGPARLLQAAQYQPVDRGAVTENLVRQLLAYLDTLAQAVDEWRRDSKLRKMHVMRNIVQELARHG